MGYSSIAWLPLCAGLTILGLVLSYLAGRRRGRLAMLRGAAWSLLPIAAYLTGSVEMFWKIGVAIGHYADGFVFSPVKWAGIAVAGVAALLFYATRGRDRRKAARLTRKTARGEAEPRTKPGAVASETRGDLDVTRILREVTHPGPAGKAPVPSGQTPDAPDKQAKPQKRAKAAPDNDDMKDIEDILRKRGI
jgi:hypothetical protein